MAVVVNSGDEHCYDHDPTPNNFERRRQASLGAANAKSSPSGGWKLPLTGDRARAARASA